MDVILKSSNVFCWLGFIGKNWFFLANASRGIAYFRIFLIETFIKINEVWNFLNVFEIFKLGPIKNWPKFFGLFWCFLVWLPNSDIWFFELKIRIFRYLL